MKTLRSVSPEKVSDITHFARQQHWMGHFMATQYWAWKGGDAIVAVADDGGAWVFLRQGKRVGAYPAAGLMTAMRAAGMDPTQFKVA